MKCADYECMSCAHRWSEQIPMVQVAKYDAEKKPVTTYQTGAEPCPRCGHLYCTWLNHEKDFAK